MLVRKARPFAPNHFFSFTSVMSLPVCCSRSWEKKAQKREEGATFLAISLNRVPQHPFFPLSASCFSHRTAVCFTTDCFIPPSTSTSSPFRHLSPPPPCIFPCSSLAPTFSSSCSAQPCESLFHFPASLSLLFRHMSAVFPRKCFI